MGQIGVSRKVDPEEAIDTSAKRARQEGVARLPGEIRYDRAKDNKDANIQRTIDREAMNHLSNEIDIRERYDERPRKKR